MKTSAFAESLGNKTPRLLAGRLKVWNCATNLRKWLPFNNNNRRKSKRNDRIKMDFAHDSTSRLSAKDEMMMGTPHASPAKPQKVRKRTSPDMGRESRSSQCGISTNALTSGVMSSTQTKLSFRHSLRSHWCIFTTMRLLFALWLWCDWFSPNWV